ncbi:hypothetical protein NW754_000041 [Fusarium falciforme]|nr:hypothetical protein NW754_000041 [Fusarium falciforme]KAJ4200480.1 hypothetical protein NW767_007544 [Fusarium falciforme]KAJ4252577.1 hypothetical protein NW757_006019 [Fusarium falciforme]
MATDSASTDTGRVNGDSGSAGHSSMLLPFIYDTSSFSDRQVQIANGGATRAETHEPDPSRPNTDASIDDKKMKDYKPVDK